jgi:hypothetical protein
MFIPHPVTGALPMGATILPLLFVLALHAPLSVTAGTADSSASPPAAERHDHPAHDHDSGSDRHADQENHDGHETTIGSPATDPDHGDNASDHRHEGEPAHDEERHLQEPEEHHDEHEHGHEETSEVHLSPEQRQTLNLEISVLEPRILGKSLRSPGEVRLNAYATAQVTPRIDAQVLARHARLGDHVEKGQRLVTLSSVDMAEAQGDLVVGEREWQRLTKL